MSSATSTPTAEADLIPYVDFPAQWAEEAEALRPRIEDVFARGEFVGGPTVATFEDELKAYLGIKHVIAVNSGTDALILAMKGLGIGPGDEVITPPNSFIASTGAIVMVGATPVFADVLDDQNIDPEAVAAAVTLRTKAIMPVHLTGRIADMEPLNAVAAEHGLAVIEDAAQAMGSALNGKKAGTLGTVGCFSAHPLKNLNAAGDAGILVTDDDAVAEKARLLRNLGLYDRNTVTEWGSVSRLDVLQAEVLRYRLSKLDSVVERRRANAALYRSLLDPAHVFIPPEIDGRFDTYHTFVVQVDDRDALVAHLNDHNIQTAIHYPMPIHLQPVAKDLGHGAGDFPVTERQAGRILSLPIHQFLSAAQITRVADTVNGFYGR